MIERERGYAVQEETVVCSECGTANHIDDRFCAECGALLPPLPTDKGLPRAAVTPDENTSTVDNSPNTAKTNHENSAWLIGARPTAVIVGGLLLLLLAAVLLAVGQLDGTGTIVMLSICTAPLGLMVLVIGIARYIAGVARHES